jgi:hypothetical protein
MTTTALHQLLDLSASRFPSKLAVYPLASALSLFKDCLCRACLILVTTNSGKGLGCHSNLCVRGPAYVPWPRDYGLERGRCAVKPLKR